MVPFPHDTVGNAWRHPWKRPVAFDPERRKSKPVTQLATQAPSHYPRPQRTNDSTLIVRYFNAYDVLTGEPLHSSREHTRLFGFDPEKGMPSFEEFLHRVHPEDQERVIETFQTLIRSGGNMDVLYRIAI